MSSESDNGSLLRDLAERVKELTALHSAARILQADWKETKTVLEQLVAIVPPAMQHPEATVARIQLGETGAATSDFANATSILRTLFTTADGQQGTIEIGFTNGSLFGVGGQEISSGHPAWGDGPFLIEECDLIRTIGEMLRTAYDRKLAEDKLRNKEQLFRALIENSSDAIALFRADAAIIYASPSTPQILGFTTEEMVQFNAFELIHPDHKDILTLAMAELIRRPWASVTRQALVRHKDGSWRWLEGTLRNLLEEPSVGAIVNNYRDITDRKQAEEELRATSDDLRALSENILSAREQEGARIAREIHDELGSALTSLKWNLEEIDLAISTASDPSQLSPLHQRIAGMSRVMDTTINVVRRIASELRPSVLDDLGLGEALEWQAQQFQERTGLICSSDCSLYDVNLTDQQTTAVFRIFQEVLTNVLRHAQATHVRFVMQEDGDEFRLTITDNGRGITKEEKSGARSLGLLGMRERAYLVGGTVDISGIKGTGTVVTLKVPISHARRT